MARPLSHRVFAEQKDRMGLFIRTIGIAPYWIALNGAYWSIEVAVNPLEYAVDEWLGAGVPKPPQARVPIA